MNKTNTSDTALETYKNLFVHSLKCTSYALDSHLVLQIDVEPHYTPELYKKSFPTFQYNYIHHITYTFTCAIKTQPQNSRDNHGTL